MRDQTDGCAKGGLAFREIIIRATESPHHKLKMMGRTSRVNCGRLNSNRSRQTSAKMGPGNDGPSSRRSSYACLGANLGGISRGHTLSSLR